MSLEEKLPLIVIKALRRIPCWPGTKAARRHMEMLVRHRPLDINIETTNFCPFGCVFCPNHKEKRPKKIMDMDLFRKICRDFYQLGGGTLALCSMQADIFSDDLLLARLSEIQKYRDRFYLYTTTNLAGAAKLSDEQLEFFLGMFDCLDISVGGLARHSYQIMCGVDAFNLVMKQLDRVAGIVKKNAFSICLDLNVRTNDPAAVRRSPAFRELKKSYSIVGIKSTFFSWGGRISQSDLPRGAKLSIVDNRLRRDDCVVPWATLSVNVDGQVVGCGCVDWEGHYIIGDMMRQTIQEVWESETAVEFRTAFSRGKVPPLCQECALYISKRKGFSGPELVAYEPIDGLYYKQIRRRKN